MILLVTIALNVYLFIRVPKGFFPQQDNGRLSGHDSGRPGHLVQAMDTMLLQMVNIIDADPAVDTVNGFTGGGRRRRTPIPRRMFISLKPLDERKVSADDVINRLRPKLARVPGATCYLQASQDLRVGGRQSNAQYQFTMRGDNLEDLITYGPHMFDELQDHLA